MATYKVQRLYSRVDEMLDKADRFQHKHPRSYRNDWVTGKAAQDSYKEVLETGKTDGAKTKKYKKAAAATTGTAGGVSGGILGAAVGAAKGGGTKGALIKGAIGAAIGAAGGAGLGYAEAASRARANAKWSKTARAKRTLDNMKVVDGEMTKKEFNRKWKVKSEKKKQ